MAVESALGRLAAERQAADQWIYVFMAGLFTLTAVIAFFPTSTGLIAAVAAGEEPPPPVILHVHAAAMTLWLLLLLAQTALMARGERRLHQRLGKVSFLLAPIVLVGMIGLVARRLDLLGSLPPDMDPALVSRIRLSVFNLTIINAGSILLFPVFYLWAILTRRKDAETHKRMIILATVATVVLMSPAIGRMVAVNPVLPDFGLNGADARHLYEVLLLTPVLVYDSPRRGMPHRAYLIGLALIASYMTVAHFLWDSSWWLQTM